MRLLIVTQYFWPETFIINDLVKSLVSQGHTVEVLTGKPNYPDGLVFAGYSATGCTEERFEESSVRVVRAPLRPRQGGGGRNLSLNYLSFAVNGLRYFHRSVAGRSFDTVLVFAPSPITAVIPAIYLKWRLKAHLAVWIQDLWPESLSATGFIRNRGLLGMVGWLVRSIYACSDTLLVQSRAFRGPVTRYARPDKIVYYPNSYRDTPLPTTRAEMPRGLREGMEHGFNVVFAGNLGTAQSVETLVRAAERLQHLRAVRLVLVGSGSKLDWIVQQKAEKGLDNLILTGRFSSSEMPRFFIKAAGLLVTLKQDEIFAFTVPSKIQAYLAAGRPIIAALNGEGARVIEDAGAGLTCPAEDAVGLARCIEQLYHMPLVEREKMGQAGRAYFLEHFEMDRQSRRLVQILENRIIEMRRHSQ